MQTLGFPVIRKSFDVIYQMGQRKLVCLSADGKTSTTKATLS